MLHRIALITVIYENYSILHDFFKSIKEQNNQNYKLFISDLSINKQPIEKPDFDFSVLTSVNKGYAHGINLGLKTAIHEKFEGFCVLNNDTILKNDFIANALTGLETHPSSIIGGKIYYAPGYEFHQERYKESDEGNVLWYAGGHIDWNHATTPHRGVDEVDSGQFNTFEETDFITGCLMCFDKQVLNKTGVWDENYFLYYEDADFCKRAKNKGIKLYYNPTLVMWHKNAQSTSGSGSKIHEKYQKENRFKFAMKYAPLRTKLHLIKNRIFQH